MVFDWFEGINEVSLGIFRSKGVSNVFITC